MAYIKAALMVFIVLSAFGCRSVREYRPIGHRSMEQVYQQAQEGQPAAVRPAAEPLRDLEVSEERIRTITSMGEQVFLDHEDAYAKGYRAGVRENVSVLASEFAGNPFPYYYWQAPLVQKVFMPSRIVGGAYVPAHYEYVIITPGQWNEHYGYPIGNFKAEIPAGSYFETRKEADKIFVTEDSE